MIQSTLDQQNKTDDMAEEDQQQHLHISDQEDLFDNIGELPQRSLHETGHGSWKRSSAMQKIKSSQDQQLQARKDDMLPDFEENQLEIKPRGSQKVRIENNTTHSEEDLNEEAKAMLPVDLDNEVDFSPTKESANDSVNESMNQNHSQNRQFLNSLITNNAFHLNFPQEMAKRLEFIQFLTKASHCKTLKES